MNGLDMLNTAPSGGAVGQAVAAKAGDAGPDDPGGDASRSFNALLATFDEPAATATQGPALPAVPAFATPPSAVLRQTLQVVAEIVPGNAAETVVALPAQAADSAPAGKKTSATSAASDDLALTDLVSDSKAPPASSQPDAAPSLQIAAPWPAAVSGAVGLVMPTLIGAAVSPAPASLRQPDAPVRGDQRLAAGGAIADGLSGDVGRLLDAAAGATEAVLSDGAATKRGTDLVLNTNVTVLRTETHLPPVTPTTPLHQLMAAITTDGLGAVTEPAAPGAPDPATAPGPERQLVRTLDIRLEPPDLGSVTVKLRLSGEHLTLRISADSAATAQSLEQDRDTLASMLRGNGYSPEISAVRHEPAAAATILTASGADSAPSSQSGANQSGSQGASDGGTRSQGGQPGSQQQSQRGFAGFEPTDGHDADVQDTASRSGLYL
jgi:chemotaxis protein MotD